MAIVGRSCVSEKNKFYGFQMVWCGAWHSDVRRVDTGLIAGKKIELLLQNSL